MLVAASGRQTRLSPRLTTSLTFSWRTRSLSDDTNSLSYLLTPQLARRETSPGSSEGPCSPPPRRRSGGERAVRWHARASTDAGGQVRDRSQGARWVCGAGARCRHNGFGSYCCLAVRLSGL